MVLPVLLPAIDAILKRGHCQCENSVCPQCIWVLAALQPIYLSTEEEGRQSFPAAAAAACLCLWLCPAARLLPLLLLLALPRLEATQPLPPASPLTAYCCCTCSKLSVRTLPIFQHMPWKHTHALTKVRRNTSPPPTITRIFATTQIPITPCPETQLCSSEDKIILVF